MYSGAVNAIMASEWEDFLPMSTNARYYNTYWSGDLNKIGTGESATSNTPTV